MARVVREHEGPWHRTRPRVAHDVDGDGIADFVWVESFDFEPRFRRATSGLLKVYSGADHSTLLAKTIATPITRAEWCGDMDHNETDKLHVLEEEPVVLALLTGNPR